MLTDFVDFTTNKFTQKNTGSTKNQIAFLTNKINKLNIHFINHKKDFNSKHGLLKIVNLRKKLLKYLKKKSSNEYFGVLNQLGLRK